jgi:hypothetical protein
MNMMRAFLVTRWGGLAGAACVAAAASAAALGGCSAPEHRVELAIELSSDGPACTATDLDTVRVVSVELLGKADGQPCSLGKRCVFDVGTLEDVDDLTALLAQANQPLVDVTDDDAHTVAILGHAESCWGTDDHVMCGYADLAEVQDGVLAVSMGCTACPTDEIVFCP